MTSPAPLPRRTTVLIADDDADVRQALADLLADDASIVLVGEARDAQGAIEIADRECPDVAILDVRMPGGGAHAAREIRRRCPGTVVIALTSFGDRRTADSMREAGAARLLVKGDPDMDVLAAVAEAAEGPA